MNIAASRDALTPVHSSRDTFTYERFFGLREKPFSLASDPRFLYPSKSHAIAFDELLAGIRRREGLLVLTGDIGTGKTTLCRAVLRHLDRKTFSAFIPDPFASREDLLKMLLIEFGVVSIQDLANGSLKSASRTELNYLLAGFLESLAPLEAFVVMFIDEAQNMSLPMIEEVRILSDTYGQTGQLQVVFVGQLELHSKLKLPEMRQVDQRVCAYCRLEPLTASAVVSYVQHRLEVAGGSPDRAMFSPDIFPRLHQASGGVPRVINRICDRALHLAYLRQAVSVDNVILESALVDVGHVDAPPTVPVVTPVSSATIVETPSEPEPLEPIEAPALLEAPTVVEAPAVLEALAAVEVPAPVKAPAPVEPLAVPASVAAAEAPQAPEALEPWAPLSTPFSASVDEWLTRAEVNPKLGIPRDPYEIPRDAFPAEPSDNTGAHSKRERSRDDIRSGSGRRERSSDGHTRTYMQKMGRRWATRAAIAAGILIGFNLVVAGASYLPTDLVAGPIELPPVTEGPAAVVPGFAVPAIPEFDFMQAAMPSETEVAGRFHVAVGLFAAEERAARLVGELTQAGLPAYFRAIRMNGDRIVQQVLLGPYADRTDAIAGLERLRQTSGFDDANVIELDATGAAAY